MLNSGSLNAEVDRMGDEIASMDAAVGRLSAAYRDAGLQPIAAPTDVEQVLHDIAEAIAPLRLTAELEQFWRTVDPDSVRVTPYPSLCSPAFALQSWLQDREILDGISPRLLFPFAYESHGFLLTELDDGHGSGGVVVQWGYGDAEFVLQFRRFAQYVDLLAQMIERGQIVQNATRAHRWIESEAWHEAQARRLASSGPIPGYGHARTVDEELRSWPMHWLRADGVTDESRALRGASTSIAALGDAESRGGTIHALVTGLVGSADGSSITVDDGTGTLDVWCPPALSPYGPRIRTRYEIDVVLRRATSTPRGSGVSPSDIQERALDADLEGARLLAIEFLPEALDQSRHVAEATALRPLDW